MVVMRGPVFKPAVQERMEFMLRNAGGTIDARNTGGVRASNSGTMEVTGTDAYGVYALNRGSITINQGGDGSDRGDLHDRCG